MCADKEEELENCDCDGGKPARRGEPTVAIVARVAALPYLKAIGEPSLV